MAKIILLQDGSLGKEGDIIIKSEDWIKFSSRKIGVEFNLFSGKEDVRLSDGGDAESFDSAYGKLTEGEKDSIRKGYRRLLLRKHGWILRDATNAAVSEIHISLPTSEERAKSGKDSAIAKAEMEMRVLKSFKDILKKSLKGEMGEFEIELEGEIDFALELVDKLSIGFAEVEILKAENEKLRKRFGAGK